MSITQIVEEGITLSLNQKENIDLTEEKPIVTKSMGTFYNPVMKIHRDISLLALFSHFKNFPRKITFCDPMVASGIREARYLKQIPTIFSKMILGDISQESLHNCKKTFEKNNISTKTSNIELKFIKSKAQQTLHHKNVDCIEIDPFGSPAPFIDSAISSANHNGLLCITATDTASLCGVYPKKAKRKYNIDISKTYCFDDLGLRALIGFCQIRAGQFDKQLIVKLSFVHAHFYRIFFEIKDSAQNSLEDIKSLKYISWDKESQEIKEFNYNEQNRIGPLYIGNLRNEEFIQKCLNEIHLLEESKTSEKLLEKINNEIQVVGYYDIHKLQSYCKLKEGVKFEILLEKIKSSGFDASLSHCDRKGLKTTMSHNKLIELIKNLK